MIRGILMHHVAVMRKSWNLTEKILSGEKKIESRWYNTRYAPWDIIHAGDTVFFKEGKHVTAKAGVSKVLQFDGLDERKVRALLDRYAKEDGIGDRKDYFSHLFKNKKYCILMFLKNPRPVKFEINKKSQMASWICVDDISKIVPSRHLC